MSIEYGSDPVNWLSLIIMGILCVFTFITTTLLFISVLQFGKSIKKASKKKRLILMSVSSNTSYTISAILLFITTIIAMIQNDPRGNYAILGKSAIGIYMLSQTLRVIVFTIRIDVLQVLRIKQSVAKTLYISAVCLIILFAAGLSTLILKIWSVAYVFGLSFGIFYLILSLFWFIYSFIKYRY